MIAHQTEPAVQRIDLMQRVKRILNNPVFRVLLGIIATIRKNLQPGSPQSDR
jgi:hypothetical protein